MIKLNIKKFLFLIGSLIALLTACSQKQEVDKFKYTYDPRMNIVAMQDIDVDENAVYGFVPSKDSKRLASFCDYDYSDPKVVEEAKKNRIEYHKQYLTMYNKWIELDKEGKDFEEIARVLSKMRNQIRLDSYKNNPEGLENVKKSNLDTYGNEEGPTPEFLYNKYGDWFTVITKSFSVNSGFDACLGLYDEEYEHNMMVGAIKNEIPVKYEVKENDTIDKIAKKYYGNPNQKSKIYNANKDILKNNDEVKIGQVLEIPLD